MTIVVHTLEHTPLRLPTVLTIGTFDGVHVGHQALIQHVIRRARSVGGSAVLVTFHPHPRTVLTPKRAPRYLQSTEERIAFLAGCGLDRVIVLHFDLHLAQTSAEDFVSLLSGRLRVRELWVGSHFALGHNREGNIAFLRGLGAKMGFTVHPIRRVSLDGEPISSSGIRTHLSEGKVAHAARLLGRYYTLSSTVVRGSGRGARMGFPTANLLSLDDDRMLLAGGVYATWAQVAGQWVPGATNIGVRPTFDNGARTVETHLIGWSEDLYDQEITLSFVQRLRDERKFSDVHTLIAQLQQDVAHAEAVLSQTPRVLSLPVLPVVES